MLLEDKLLLEDKQLLEDNQFTKLDTQLVVNTEMSKPQTTNTFQLVTNKVKLPTRLEDQESEYKVDIPQLDKDTLLVDQESEDLMLELLKTLDTDLYSLSYIDIQFHLFYEFFLEI